MRIETKFDREKIWYRGSSSRFLVVNVSDAGAGRPPRPVGLNIALVVDASGSMAGEPLQFAVTAAQRLIGCLSDEDRLSVVSFNSDVTDHLTAEPMTAAGRARALHALDTIRASGRTNLSAGWLRGAEHVARTMDSGSPSQHRVIVLSDGHANEGIVDPAALALHAEQLGLRRLFSSTVGIGDHYNSETLEAIAVHGGGAHHRAARPHEIVEVLTAELQDIRLVTAENITVTIQAPAGLRIKCLNDFPLTHQDGRYVCNLGSLTAAASRTAVFRVKFPAGEVGAKCPLQVRTTWRSPGGDDVYCDGPLSLNAEFARSRDNDAQRHDPSLCETIAQVWQAYIVRRIVRLNREGRYAEAVKRLDQDLPSFSRFARNAPSGVILIAELQRLRDAASREWTEGNRKEVEVAMYHRRYTLFDARMAKPEDWIAHATAEPKPPHA